MPSYNIGTLVCHQDPPGDNWMDPHMSPGPPPDTGTPMCHQDPTGDTGMDPHVTLRHQRDTGTPMCHQDPPVPSYAIRTLM